MGNEIAYLMATKHKIFLGKEVLPPYHPHQGASPWTPANTLLTDCPSHNSIWNDTHAFKHAKGAPPFFWWQSGKWATRGIKNWWKHGISGGNGTNWESITKSCEFYPLKRAFQTLKPMSFRGLRPLDPGATMESPLKMVQIDNSLWNYMWILPPILPFETGFPGLLKH